jgi:hypothetical protein
LFRRAVGVGRGGQCRTHSARSCSAVPLASEEAANAWRMASGVGTLASAASRGDLRIREKTPLV